MRPAPRLVRATAVPGESARKIRGNSRDRGRKVDVRPTLVSAFRRQGRPERDVRRAPAGDSSYRDLERRLAALAVPRFAARGWAVAVRRLTLLPVAVHDEPLERQAVGLHRFAERLFVGLEPFGDRG